MCAGHVPRRGGRVGLAQPPLAIAARLGRSASLVGEGWRSPSAARRALTTPPVRAQPQLVSNLARARGHEQGCLPARCGRCLSAWAGRSPAGPGTLLPPPSPPPPGSLGVCAWEGCLGVARVGCPLGLTGAVGPQVGATWVRFHAAGAAASTPKEPARSGGRRARACRPHVVQQTRKTTRIQPGRKSYEEWQRHLA